MEEKKTYHFISHTHWDREWYLPMERFRYRLVHLIDKLLDLLDRDPEFKYFHLDGQTIVLEDYYALRPGHKEKLERYIQSGRILIGPWYQQNDLYLTSAESTVRNLIEGVGTSRKLGGEMKVGYLPDHFGLIGQMPQIFNEVGLTNSVFGRGIDYETHKEKGPNFYWESPDGSVVTGHLLYHWYNNAQRLPSDEKILKSVFDNMREREEEKNNSAHYIMMNGVDHLEAQYDLSEVLAKLQHLYGDEIDVIHDTLPNTVDRIQQYMQSKPEDTYEVVHGELREAFEYSILASTLSSRVYIKKANLECHDLIEKWIEPLSTWCQTLSLDNYEAGTLQYIWKLYMENHPHDSICGCSLDEVHDHMMDRSQRIREIAKEVIDRKLSVLARQVDPSGYELEDIKLFAVNTSQLKSSAVQQTSLYFMREDAVEDFAIVDSEGNEIPYRLISKQPSRIQVLSPINLPGVLAVTRHDIEWKPEIPALGYHTYKVSPHKKGSKVIENPVRNNECPILENEQIRVEIQTNGSFHILDKQTGKKLLNQGRFEDAGDSGDLYVFKESEGDQKCVIWDGEVEFIEHVSNELYDECIYRFDWELPSELNPDRKTRSELNQSNAFHVTLRLDRIANQVDMKINMDNPSKDHRIRLLFTTDQTVDHVLAGGQFDVVKRSWDSGKEWTRDANSQPFWKWFAPVIKEHGIAVFAKGLHEYEMTDEGRTAGVTLVRGVENMFVREVVHLEQDIQPKGQCLGNQLVELAIRPFSSEVSATQLYQEAERFHQGIQVKSFAIDEQRWSKGRAWVQDTVHDGLFMEDNPNKDKPSIPLSGSYLQMQGDVMLSAYKWSEDGKDPIVRLYNVEGYPVQVKLKKERSENGNTVELVNLLEEPKEVLQLNDGAAAWSVEAKKIVTMKG